MKLKNLTFFVALLLFLSLGYSFGATFDVTVISRSPSNGEIFDAGSSIPVYLGIEVTPSIGAPDQVYVKPVIDGFVDSSIGTCDMSTSCSVSHTFSSDSVYGEVGTHTLGFRIVSATNPYDYVSIPAISYEVHPVESVSLYISSPSDGATFYTSDTVTLSAGLTTNVEGTAYLYINNNLVKTWSIAADTSNSLTYSSTFSSGSYTFYYKFVTSQNIYTTSSRSFSVTTPPATEEYYWAVYNLEPSNGSSYEESETITFSGKVETNVGGDLTLWIDDSQITGWTITETSTETYQTTLLVGNHTFYWKFTLTNGTYVTTDTYNVYVYHYVPLPVGTGSLANFTRRKPINITTSETASNYPLYINVSYDPDMQTDFDDIRFSDESGTILAYYLDEKVDGSWATFYVKLPTLDNETIYMYYGNPDAVSESNGENVFTFFEDGEDGIITTSLSTWTGGSGTVTESGGVVNVDSGATTDGSILYYATDLGEGFCVDAYWTYTTSGNQMVFELGSAQIFGAYTDYSPTRKVAIQQLGSGGIEVIYYDTSNAVHWWNFDTDTWQTSATSFAGALGTQYRFRICQVNDEFRLYVYNSSGLIDVATIDEASVRNGDNANYWRAGDPTTTYWLGNLDLDNIKSYTYVYPEPSISFGAEEAVAGEMEINLTTPADNDKFYEGDIPIVVGGATPVWSNLKVYFGSYLVYSTDIEQNTSFYVVGNISFFYPGEYNVTAYLVRNPTLDYPCGGYIPCDTVVDYSENVTILPQISLVKLSPYSSTIFSGQDVVFSAKVTNYMDNKTYLVKLNLYKDGEFYSTFGSWQIEPETTGRELILQTSLPSGNYTYQWEIYGVGTSPKIIGPYDLEVRSPQITVNPFDAIRDVSIGVINGTVAEGLTPMLFVVFSPYTFILVMSLWIGSKLNLGGWGLGLVGLALLVVFSFFGWIPMTLTIIFGIIIVGVTGWVFFH